MEIRKQALEEEKKRREDLEKRLQEETSRRQKLIDREVKLREKQRAQVRETGHEHGFVFISKMFILAYSSVSVYILWYNIAFFLTCRPTSSCSSWIFSLSCMVSIISMQTFLSTCSINHLFFSFMDN